MRATLKLKSLEDMAKCIEGSICMLMDSSKEQLSKTYEKIYNEAQKRFDGECVNNISKSVMGGFPMVSKFISSKESICLPLFEALFELYSIYFCLKEMDSEDFELLFDIFMNMRLSDYNETPESLLTSEKKEKLKTMTGQEYREKMALIMIALEISEYSAAFYVNPYTDETKIGILVKSWLKYREIFFSDEAIRKVPKYQGCYIATCVYGSYDCPEVWVLRRYRDFKLGQTFSGRLFIKIYYFISPILVKLFGKKKWFKSMFKKKIENMVLKYKKLGYDDTPYEDINW